MSEQWENEGGAPEQLSMETEPWWSPDFKEGKRVKASREQWKKLREEKVGPCRVCGQSDYKGGIELHHLVSRGQQGDDIPDNLVPVCTEHHRLIEARDHDTCQRLRYNLSDDEIHYVIQKKGTDWLDQRYPYDVVKEFGDRFLADFEREPILIGKSFVGDDGTTITVAPEPPIEPGNPCPTCKRRVPHPKKATSPSTQPYSFRIPNESRDSFKEMLEAAAEHLGLSDKPFHHYRVLEIGIVLALQADPDLLK